MILASGSPRRQAYLEDMGIDFKVLVADIDESPIAGEQPRSYVCRLGRRKAMEVMKKNTQTWVLAADTIVSLDDKILGKPKSVEEAVNTLLLLSGRVHEVATAFCLGCKDKSILHEECVVTKVRFAPFTEDVARVYVDTGEPFDKAGGYGIQGRGAFLVSGVEGSYSNVVGLPLYEVIAALQKHKIVDVR